MESQLQNPEFRINPENFHKCIWHLLCHVLKNIGELYSKIIWSTFEYMQQTL